MTTNILLDSTGTNELTVYCTKIEEIFTKTLIKIMPGTSTGNYASGVKKTKIVDLLRIDHMFNINGYIDSADRAKMRNIIQAGGVFAVVYAGTSYNCNIEKLSILEQANFQIDSGSPSDNPSQYDVTFSLVVGENI